MQDLFGGLFFYLIFYQKTITLKNFPNSSFVTGVVVLTGGKMRIEKGIQILQKGYADKMFISGVFMPSEIEMKFKIEKTKKDLLDCCIYFGEKS